MRNLTGTLPAIGPFKTFVARNGKLQPRRATRFHLPKERVVMGGRCVRLIPCDAMDKIKAYLSK